MCSNSPNEKYSLNLKQFTKTLFKLVIPDVQKDTDFLWTKCLLTEILSDGSALGFI